MFKKILIEYLFEIKEINLDGKATEVSYRTPFQNFLLELLNYYSLQKDLQIRHEDKAIDTEYGNATPDFSIKTKQGSFITGYIETKRPNEPYFNEIEKSKQLVKYLSINDNILATNYLNFKFLYQKEDKLEVNEIFFGSAEYLTESYLDSPSMLELIKKLEINFRNFFCKPIKKIANPKQLAVSLGNISKLLREYLLEEINKQAKNERGELYQIYISFRNNLSESMDKEEFIDAFAQMVSYAVFLAKLNIKNEDSVEIQNTLLTINNIKEYININFSLIAEMVKYLDVLTNPKKDISLKCGWLLEELLFVVNNIDMYAVGEYLSYNKSSQEKVADPYLYFYEDFLQQYDKGLKIDRGVYYTPPQVVQYIVKSTSEILKEELDIQDGFADKSVKVLDFATGTGTFILDVYKEILDNLPNNSAKTKSIISDIVLKNIYGFEYLMAPYVVAHLKLSEYLKSKNYKMNINERIQIYLTNTLSQLSPQYDSFLPELSQEGEKAHEIKESEDIMVVLGNPPYNSKSKNPILDNKGKENFIGSLLKDYKPVDEKTITTLGDDYIKFIRFAHNKLSSQNKGILSVIVNNSFINGLTHRKMRNELLKEFSSIYILNLHGDSRKKESTPNGGIDQNVFDIMQGVAIAIFVKNGLSNNKVADVYYQDLWGLREEKYNYLANNTYKTTSWEKIDIEGFNRDFSKSLWANQKEEISKQTQPKKQFIEELFLSEELEDSNYIEKKHIEKKRFEDALSFFVPIKKEGILSYGNSIGMNEIFVEYSSGVKSARDNLAIQLSKNEMQQVQIDLKTLSDEYIRNKYNLRQDNSWQLGKAVEKVYKNSGNIELIQYRVFDNRYTYYSSEAGFLERPRYKILQHFLLKNNVGFSFIRNTYTSNYNHFLAVKNIMDLGFMGGQTYTTPIYLTESKITKISRQVTKDKQIHDYKEDRWLLKDNFSSYFKDFIKEKYNLDISYSGGEQFNENNPNKSNIELVCGYIYAVMYSKEYKEKYIEYLRIDFPRIIFVDDKNKFLELAKLGKQLMFVHKDQKVSQKNNSINPQFLYDGIQNNEIIKASLDKEKSRLYINKSTYFSCVSEEVFEYKMGDAKILEKYINARKIRCLSLEEIEHIENIIKVIYYTIDVEKKISESNVTML